MPPDDPAQTASDQAAVLEVVRQFDEALQRGDHDAAARLCLDDFVFFGSGLGEESRGAHALGEMFDALRARVGADLVSWQLVLEPHDVAVRGDCARVSASGHFDLVLRNSSRQGRYLLTGALLRTPHGWRWWTFHGSEPQPW